MVYNCHEHICRPNFCHPNLIYRNKSTSSSFSSPYGAELYPIYVPSWPNVHDCRAFGIMLYQGTIRIECNRWTIHRMVVTILILREGQRKKNMFLFKWIVGGKKNKKREEIISVTTHRIGPIKRNDGVFDIKNIIVIRLVKKKNG